LFFSGLDFLKLFTITIATNSSRSSPEASLAYLTSLASLAFEKSIEASFLEPIWIDCKLIYHEAWFNVYQTKRSFLELRLISRNCSGAFVHANNFC
jgi:hypothetical protein